MKKSLPALVLALLADALTFGLCCVTFWLLFRLCRTDFANRVGYLLWLRASPEDQVNYFRLLFVKRTLPLAASLVAGATGVAIFNRAWRQRALARIRQRPARPPRSRSA
jgi:hypothetical protein